MFYFTAFVKKLLGPSGSIDDFEYPGKLSVYTMKSDSIPPHESVIFQPWTKGTEAEPMDHYCKIHIVQDDEQTLLNKMLVENVPFNKKFHHAMDINVYIRYLYTIISALGNDCWIYSEATSNCSSFSKTLINDVKKFTVMPKDKVESQKNFDIVHTPWYRKWSPPIAEFTEFYKILQHTLPFMIIISRTFPRANCALAFMLLIIQLVHVYCDTISFRNVWKILKTAISKRKWEEDHTDPILALLQKIYQLYVASFILWCILFTNESFSTVIVLWYASARIDAKRRDFFIMYKGELDIIELYPTAKVQTDSGKKIFFVCVAEYLPELIISLSSVLPHNLFILGNLFTMAFTVIMVRWSRSDEYAAMYLGNSSESLFGTRHPRLQEMGVFLYTSLTIFAFFQGSTLPKFSFDHLLIQVFGIVIFFSTETYLMKTQLELRVEEFESLTEMFLIFGVTHYNRLCYYINCALYIVKCYWVMGMILLCSLIVANLLQWQVYLYLVFTVYAHVHSSSIAFILRAMRTLSHSNAKKEIDTMVGRMVEQGLL